MDAGDFAEHIGADTESVHGRLEPGVDLDRGQRVRSIDVGKTGDGDVLKQHGIALGGNPPKLPGLARALNRNRRQSCSGAVSADAFGWACTAGCAVRAEPQR